MKKILTAGFACILISAGLLAQSNFFPNGVLAYKGTSAGGAAIFVGTTYASHFSYSTEEDTYIRGGKNTSRVYINDVGADVVLGNAAGSITYSQGLLQAQNGLVGMKGNSAGGSALFVGTNYISHFNYSTTEDTYIRGGKTSSNVILGDVGNAVVVGSVPSLPAGYKLYVDKGILTEKVKVAIKTSANWADYVFAPGYKLQSLGEVETFIKNNRHLPGVPSAQQLINDGGVDVSSMLAKQMEKIEELTLHMIEMKKEIKQLQDENNLLKKIKGQSNK